MISYLVILLISIDAFSQNRTNIFKGEDLKKPEKNEQIRKIEKPKIMRKTKFVTDSNLPDDYALNSRPFSLEESPVVLPTNRSMVKFKEVRSGDLLSATILESVFAYNDSKVPVRALIASGSLKDSILIGEATLEKNSKRVQIEFKKFRDSKTKEIYQTQAHLMDSKGIFGIEGHLISNEKTHFLAELLSAGAAGYADATISREQNFLGNTNEAKTEDTYAKRALTSALSRSADRFSEKLKQSQEYSVLEGPIQVQVLILEQPTLVQ